MLGEGANGNGDVFLQTVDFIVHRCTAIRAETERDPASLVADAHILRRSTVNLHAAPAEPGLRTENAAGTALASKTVTDRDPDWVFRRCRGELAAATGGDAFFHG